VARLHQDLLGRDAAPAEVASWAGRVDSGELTRTNAALAIEGSTESRFRQLQKIYDELLHRSLDSSGSATWLRFLQAGGTLEQVRAAVLGSDEYYQRRGDGYGAGFLAAV
jgi:hypothetical protein